MIQALELLRLAKSTSQNKVTLKSEEIQQPASQPTSLPAGQPASQPHHFKKKRMITLVTLTITQHLQNLLSSVLHIHLFSAHCTALIKIENKKK